MEYRDLKFGMFEISARADDMNANGSDIIKLAIGIPEFPIPEDALNSLLSSLKDNSLMHQVHPQGLPQLRKAISQRCQGASPEDVLVHNGTSPIHHLLYNIILRENNKILLPKPWYPLYMMSAFLSNAEIFHYSLNSSTNEFESDDIVRIIDSNQPKLVVINTPGNPLGNQMSIEDILKVVDFCSERSIYVLVDEVYIGLSSRFNESFRNVFHQYDNLIVTESLSKSWSMYTLRLGFALIPKSIQSITYTAMSHLALTVNPAIQKAAIVALSDNETPKRIRDIYSKRRAILKSSLGKHAPFYSNPIEGMYSFLNCDNLMNKLQINNSLDLCHIILEKTGVALTPGSDFGLDRGVRISFNNDRFEEAIKRLAIFLDKEITI